MINWNDLTIDDMFNNPEPYHERLTPLKEDLHLASHIGVLKPCPFCGNNQPMSYGRINKLTRIIGYVIICGNEKCLASIHSTYGRTQLECRNDAVKKWNGRE